jgi:uncharacterized membrane protein
MANESVTAGGVAQTGVNPLEPRVLGVGRGAAWWGEGWRLFTPSVGTWLLIAVIGFVLFAGLSLCSKLLALLPLIGHPIATFLFSALSVLLTGGLMIGCRSVDRGNTLTIGHMFAGFSQRTKPLLLLALIYTALLIAIAVLVALIMVALFGYAMLSTLASVMDPAELGIGLGTIVSAMLTAALLFLLLWLPVVMLVWFAPALIMLGGLEPWPAMLLSFRGCLKNFAPFLVYGAIGVGLAVVASIPVLLGWLVLYPVTVTTVYASYCDIFEDEDTV